MEFKGYFQTHYKVYQGTADLYTYFIELGISLLQDGGIFSYIVANKWMRANYGKALRKFLLERTSLQEIIDFGELPVFQNSSTFPAILLLRNEPTESQRFLYAPIKNLNFLSLDDEVKSKGVFLDDRSIEGDNWSLADDRTQSLLGKLKMAGVPLGEFVQGKIYRGVLTGLNEAFVIDETTRAKLIAEDASSAELIKPFLAGREIKRYVQPESSKYLIFTRRGVDINNYPAIKRHLIQFEERLMPKPKNWKGGAWNGRKPGTYQWYEIQDSIDYHAEFEKQKIIWPEIAKSIRFAICPPGIYTNNKVFILPIADLFLLGILNSRITWFYLKHICSILGDADKGGRPMFQEVFVKTLPIRTIDFSDPADVARHDRMVTLVDQMLALHKQLPQARTPHEQTALQRQIEATDRQIDALVYELYALTEEEIAIVEGNAR